MRILAIDPGPTMSAWCDLHDGLPWSTGKVDNKHLMAKLGLDVWAPEGGTLAVEMIASYGMAVGKEVFETCLWIGRFLQAWESFGGKTMLVYRRDVKLHHCHSARATDANVRAALLDRFGPGKEIAVGTKANRGPLYGIKGDEWAALAVALTAEATLSPKREPLFIQGTEVPF